MPWKWEATKPDEQMNQWQQAAQGKILKQEVGWSRARGAGLQWQLCTLESYPLFAAHTCLQVFPWIQEKIQRDP